MAHFSLDKYIRTLKELDEKEDWARFMKKINRKTLVVCKDCHSKIHKKQTA